MTSDALGTGEFDSAWICRVRRQVRRWYEREGRNLPWRGERDPYRVWVREIMLQQTTVVAVIPYLERFLKRFPTVNCLASAREEEVLQAWEGLGYYTRARNLRRAAQVVVKDWGGCWQRDVDALEALPGVGPYTAAAVASFAFGNPAGIVEANTQRLYARLLSFEGDVSNTQGKRLLWALANRLVTRQDPGQFNQALMDLGATVCVAEPACARCPLRSSCGAATHGLVSKIPRKTPRPTVTDVHESLAILRQKNEWLVVRHPDGGRWGGLWGFPALELSSELLETPDHAGQLEREWLKRGVEVRFQRWVGRVHHSVTRFRLHLHVVQFEWVSGELGTGTDWRWMSPVAVERLPLSVAGRKVARMVSSGEATPS